MIYLLKLIVFSAVIPVPNADANTKFFIRPEAPFTPIKRWGSEECVILFDPPDNRKYYLFIAYGSGKGEVIVLGEEPIPDPDPDPDPSPIPEPPLVKIIKPWLPEQRPKMKELADTYILTGERIIREAKTSEEAIQMIRRATSQLGPDKAYWLDFSNSLNQYMQQQEDGSPLPPKVIGNIFKQVGEALCYLL